MDDHQRRRPVPRQEIRRVYPDKRWKREALPPTNRKEDLTNDEDDGRR